VGWGACIFSHGGPPRLFFEPLILSFHFIADPDADSAFHSNADPDPALKNNADPDRQPCFKIILMAEQKNAAFSIWFLCPSHLKKTDLYKIKIYLDH
jgi:hypothetical protein